LREALAAYLGVGAEMVVPTNGGAEALFLAARAAGTEGKALVLEPTFSEYAAAARASGMEPVRRLARRPEEGLRWDPTSYRDLEGISVVFLCNPNNPTGDSLGYEEVLEVAARVEEAGAVLVVDEAFADFVPGISVTAMVERGLWVVRSFTKFFAIPGLRLGCLVCDDPRRVQALQPSWPVNSVAAAAGTAAVRDRGFAETSVAEVACLRKDLFGVLDALPGLQPFPGAANFLLVRGPGELPERLARRGVLVRGCGPFYGLGPEYFRVAVRSAEENERLVVAIREEL
jgi:threonine-phosphate decarboxylase